MRAIRIQNSSIPRVVSQPIAAGAESSGDNATLRLLSHQTAAIRSESRGASDSSAQDVKVDHGAVSRMMGYLTLEKPDAAYLTQLENLVRKLLEVCESGVYGSAAMCEETLEKHGFELQLHLSLPEVSRRTRRGRVTPSGYKNRDGDSNSTSHKMSAAGAPDGKIGHQSPIRWLTALKCSTTIAAIARV